MRLHNKVIAGSIIAGALALAPLAFAEDAAMGTAGTTKPEVKLLPKTALKKAQVAVNKTKTVIKKVDPKTEAAKKNKIHATNTAIVKKMEATKGIKQREAEAKMKAQLEEMKAKAQATTPQQ